MVRARFFTSHIVKSAGGRRVNVLDLGSGDCWFAEQLLPCLPLGSTITCCDINFSDIDLDEPIATGITKVRDLPSGIFDIIVLLDVIEHVADDFGFLKVNVHSKLNEGGTVLISVPAHPSLFSEHDEFLGHHRRYTRRQLLDLVSKISTPKQNGYLFVSLALARYFQRLLPKKLNGKQSGVGAWTSGRFLTVLVTLLLSLDALASIALRAFHIHLPGLTVWVSSNGKVVNPQ